MAKQLEDARDGLLRYWQLVPSGGTRADLISRAIQQGFEEPLLNEWLDKFLQGFVDMDWIAAPDYDLALVPRLQEAGYAKAERAVNAVFLLLTAEGDVLYVVRLQNQVVELQDQLAEYQAKITRLDQAAAWVGANAPAGAVRDEGLLALTAERARAARAVAGLQTRIAALQAEIAALTGP